MKRIFLIILSLILTTALLGCNPSASNEDNKSDEVNKVPNTDAGIMGYVMKLQDGRILVVDPVAQNFSSTGGVSEFYNAIWFSKAPKGVNIGDKVKVWYDIVLDSYPGQSEAMAVEVVAAEKPTGADLTESEALRKALASKEINTEEVLVVKSIEFDAQADKWNIELKGTLLETTISKLQIEDKQ